jgi:hypothetical protein
MRRLTLESPFKPMTGVDCKSTFAGGSIMNSPRLS